MTDKTAEIVPQPTNIECGACGAVVAAFADGNMCCHCQSVEWMFTSTPSIPSDEGLVKRVAKAMAADQAKRHPALAFHTTR